MGRRGPKKKFTDVKREPSGRPSRNPEQRAARQARDARDASKIGIDEWEAMSTALMARMRVHHVPMDKLRDQMAGSYIGRLCLAHLGAGCDETVGITRVQFDAAQAYLTDRLAYHLAIDAPKQMPAVDLNAVHGRNHIENVKRSQNAIERYRAVESVILNAQQAIGNRGNLWAAIDLCVVKEIELHHMLGDTRLVLNALARHYGLESRRAA